MTLREITRAVETWCLDPETEVQEPDGHFLNIREFLDVIRNPSAKRMEDGSVAYQLYADKRFQGPVDREQIKAMLDAEDITARAGVRLYAHKCAFEPIGDYFGWEVAEPDREGKCGEGGEAEVSGKSFAALRDPIEKPKASPGHGDQEEFIGDDLDGVDTIAGSWRPGYLRASVVMIATGLFVSHVAAVLTLTAPLVGLGSTLQRAWVFVLGMLSLTLTGLLNFRCRERRGHMSFDAMFGHLAAIHFLVSLAALLLGLADEIGYGHILLGGLAFALFIGSVSLLISYRLLCEDSAFAQGVLVIQAIYIGYYGLRLVPMLAALLRAH